MSNAQDSRRDPRAKVLSMTVRYRSATVAEFLEDHSHDISRGGLFIKTPSPFPAGTLLKFEVRLAEEQKVMMGVGRVAWKREETQEPQRPAGMGVKFIKIDNESIALIDRLTSERGDESTSFEQGAEESGIALSEPPPELRGRGRHTVRSQEPGAEASRADAQESKPGTTTTESNDANEPGSPDHGGVNSSSLPPEESKSSSAETETETQTETGPDAASTSSGTSEEKTVSPELSTTTRDTKAQTDPGNGKPVHSERRDGGKGKGRRKGKQKPKKKKRRKMGTGIAASKGSSSSIKKATGSSRTSSTPPARGRDGKSSNSSSPPSVKVRQPESSSATTPPRRRAARNKPVPVALAGLAALVIAGLVYVAAQKSQAPDASALVPEPMAATQPTPEQKTTVKPIVDLDTKAAASGAPEPATRAPAASSATPTSSASASLAPAASAAPSTSAPSAASAASSAKIETDEEKKAARLKRIRAKRLAHKRWRKWLKHKAAKEQAAKQKAAKATVAEGTPGPTPPSTPAPAQPPAAPAAAPSPTGG